MTTISNALRTEGKAEQETLLRFLPTSMVGRNEIAAVAGYIQSAGSPAGTVTPDFIGQRCFDTVGKLWYVATGVSNTDWTLRSAGVLAQSGIPFILPGGTAGGGSNQFTMGNNGAVSTLQALPSTYDGGAWMYFPANTITGSNPAGWYWFVASSTTAGTVYNNTYTTGSPAAPTTLIPFVSTGPGLGTQTTGADITAMNFTMIGGSMGPNGAVENWWNGAQNNSAGNKIWNEKWGATSMWSRTRTTTTMENPMYRISNRGRQDRQFCDAQGGPGSSLTSAGSVTSIDTSANIAVSITMQIAAASDFMLLNAYRSQLSYGG